MKNSYRMAVFLFGCGLLSDAYAVCESTPDPKCIQAALEGVDQQLNVLYRRLVSTGTQAQQETLRDEQRKWLARRNTECRLDSKGSVNDKWLQSLSRDGERADCVYEKTLARVRELQDLPTIAVDRLVEVTDAYQYNVPFGRQTGKAYAEISFPAKGYPTAPPTPLVQVAMTDGQSLVGMQAHLSHMASLVRPDGDYVVGLAVDYENAKFYYSENGVWNSTPGSSSGADLKPGTTYSIRLISAGQSISNSLDRGGIRINTGNTPFLYETPAGYQPFHVSPVSSPAALPAALVPSFQRISGKSVEEWAERYWAWLLPKQPARNPVLDSTGRYCADDQAGPVWFLSSADAKSRITRSCTIPKGKFILVPAVANLLYSTAGVQPCAKIENDRVGQNGAAAIQSVFVTVDGERFDALYDYRAYTDKCTTIRGDAGEKIVSDLVFWGSWVLLYPLSEGDHVISFGGELPAINASRSVTYKIRIE